MRNFDDYRTFESRVNVFRCADTGTFHAEIAIRCIETGEVMRFRGDNLWPGSHPDKASVGALNFSLRVPLEPPDESLPEGWNWDRAWQTICEPALRVLEVKDDAS